MTVLNDKWKLKRTKQCEKCPWRVDVDPNEIPHYRNDLHHSLISTIAGPNALDSLCNPIVELILQDKVMACHESQPEDGMHCIGWLMNQIGAGNNIGLRMRMMTCENASQIELVGEQHEIFEDTLP